MKHIAFVTDGFYPANPGGAGVLISGAVRALARAGFYCTVVCDCPESEVRQVQCLLSGEDLSPGVAQAVGVATLLGVEQLRPWRQNPFEQRSRALAHALQRLHRQRPIDLIEFPEYAGLALSALADKVNAVA